MKGNVIPHLYFLFGIIIFMLNEAAFQSAGFWGYLFFYLSILFILGGASFIVRNRFKQKSREACLPTLDLIQNEFICY